MSPDATRDEVASPRWGTIDGPASTEALVDAFGMAYATFTLYDDPTIETAFVRAIDTLGHSAAYPWRVETGVDGFLASGEPVPVRREGSLRVSRRLFSLGVAALDLMEPPRPGDLMALFEVITLDQGDGEARTALAGRGVTSIRLLDRAMLFGDEEPVDDPQATRAAAIGEDHPAAFVLSMLSDESASPADVALRFVEEYERAHLLVDLDDAWGMEELIHAFVEGFSYLPEIHRASIFSLLLQRGHRPENTAFLDQLSGLEIAELDRMFGSQGHPLLAEYLRVAENEGGRPADQLGRGSDPARSLSAQIVDQVAAVLRATGGAGDSLTEQALHNLSSTLPDDDAARRSVTNVLRGLLDLVSGDGVESFAKVWAGRIVAAFETGDFAAADDWLSSAIHHSVASEDRRILFDALGAAACGPALDAVVALLADPPAEGPGSMTASSAPLFAADALVEALAAEGHKTRRKPLLRALQVIARHRPAALLPHLGDERWHVVRNAVVALGTSRWAGGAGHLRPLLSHPEHRVRIEVIRGLRRLEGDGAATVLLDRLHDSHATVRTEAGRLLGTVDAPAVDHRLEEITRSDDLDEARSAVAALGKRHTPAAAQILTRLAARRGFFGRPRALRKAARHALEAQRE